MATNPKKDNANGTVGGHCDFLFVCYFRKNGVEATYKPLWCVSSELFEMKPTNKMPMGTARGHYNFLCELLVHKENAQWHKRPLQFPV